MAEEVEVNVNGWTIVKSIGYFIGGIFVLMLLLDGYVIIDGGQRGVVFSKVDGVQDIVLNEGFHFKKPYIDQVIIYDARTQKEDFNVASTSFDQQIVSANVAVNYHINADSANKIYQELGTDYSAKVIAPAVHQAVKNVMAQYKAEEIIQKRDELTLKIAENLREQLKDRYVSIEVINLVNIDFSAQYNAAIESKVVAEQNKFKAENDLKRIEVEAQQKVAEANGTAQAKILQAQADAQSKLLVAEAEAKAITLQGEALEKSKDVIELRQIEKWDGKLPTIMTGDNSGLLLQTNMNQQVKVE